MRCQSSIKNVAIGILFCLVINLSCIRSNNAPNDSSPLFLAIGYDVSGSVVGQGFQKLSMMHIERLLSIMKNHGGTLAFGLIDENANEQLIRVKLIPVVGRLEERARKNSQNKKAISEFRMKVETKINRPRNAKYTDVNGALARLALFYNEPLTSYHEKILLFISDGIHTGGRNRYLKAKLPADVKVIAVGMSAEMAEKSFSQSVMNFENIGAAIEIIENQKSSNGRS